MDIVVGWSSAGAHLINGLALGCEMSFFDCGDSGFVEGGGSFTKLTSPIAPEIPQNEDHAEDEVEGEGGRKP